VSTHVGNETGTGLVSIVCPNPNLSVRYTCDGSEPNATSPVYSGPFPLREGGVVKAFAFVNDLSRSEIAPAFFGVDRSSWKVVSDNGSCPAPTTSTAASASHR